MKRWKPHLSTFMCLSLFLFTLIHLDYRSIHFTCIGSSKKNIGREQKEQKPIERKLNPHSVLAKYWTSFPLLPTSHKVTHEIDDHCLLAFSTSTSSFGCFRLLYFAACSSSDVPFLLSLPLNLDIQSHGCS